MRYPKCHYCGEGFRAFRSDAKFCSDSCRVSYSQLPARFSSKAANGYAAMVDIYDLALRFPEKMDEAEKQFAWLQERLTFVRARLQEIKKA